MVENVGIAVQCFGQNMQHNSIAPEKIILPVMMTALVRDYGRKGSIHYRRISQDNFCLAEIFELTNK